MLYILLTGEPPFYDEDNFELFEKIKTGNFTMNQPVWKEVSPEVIDLIKKLLLVEPSKRLTASQI